MSDDFGPLVVEVVSPDPQGHGGRGHYLRGRVGVVVGINGQFVQVQFDDGTRYAFTPEELRSYGEKWSSEATDWKADDE